MEHHSELTNFIWSVADLLRGDYKQSEYGRVILPLTVIRRLDSVLAPTKAKVLAEHEKYKDKLGDEALADLLNRAAGHTFHNTSKLDFATLVADAPNIAVNLKSYLAGFSENARRILDHFEFHNHIARLEKAKILYLIIQRFNQIDLHPDRVSNVQMGYIYEDLIRRFSEQSNETAGEHFTPREVIKLMVNLLFASDQDVLTDRHIVRTIYDPACGTGGMLSVAENHLRNLNPDATLEAFGQEINPETYATCVSDMMLKGHDTDNIVFGNTFTEDGLPTKRFDYMLTNPPFGVDWKKYQQQVKDEHEQQGWQGRFGAGLPRVSDGSLLFLQHMMSKMKAPQHGGSRLAIVFNASPLFTGAAGSGESEIRRWIIENDWLDAIVALPDQLFYNTGISTYVWVLTNRKTDARKGKVQLIDARDLFQKMRKSLGDKRNELSDDHIAEITGIYADFAESDRSKIFPNDHFGFHRITVERPMRGSWVVGDEAIESIEAHRSFEKMKPDQQAALLDAVRAIRDDYGTDETALVDKLKAATGERGLKLSATIKKLVLGAAYRYDLDGEPLVDENGNPQPDSDLRDYENVPLVETIEEYMQREVLPHVPGAWVDETRTKAGYEIPFTREFYVYEPPRPLKEIDAEIEALESEILELLREVRQ